MRFHALPCSRALCSALAERAKREVQHLDREPAAERVERAVDDRVVAARQRDLRVPAVDHLADRLEERRRVVDRRERREADGEPLREGLVRVGAGSERPQERPDRPVPRWDCAEHVRQRCATRPPELVGVRVDHPVGAEVRRRQARHARDPFVLPEVVAGLANEMDMALARVPLEHLGRPVLRVVVGRDHEVRARVQVELEPRLDDVRPRPSPAVS